MFNVSKPTRRSWLDPHPPPLRGSETESALISEAQPQSSRYGQLITLVAYKSADRPFIDE
jgi:hypothetical protein